MMRVHKVSFVKHAKKIHNFMTFFYALWHLVCVVYTVAVHGVSIFETQSHPKKKEEEEKDTIQTMMPTLYILIIKCTHKNEFTLKWLL